MSFPTIKWYSRGRKPSAVILQLLLLRRTVWSCSAVRVSANDASLKNGIHGRIGSNVVRQYNIHVIERINPSSCVEVWIPVAAGGHEVVFGDPIQGAVESNWRPGTTTVSRLAFGTRDTTQR